MWIFYGVGNEGGDFSGLGGGCITFVKDFFKTGNKFRSAVLECGFDGLVVFIEMGFKGMEYFSGRIFIIGVVTIGEFADEMDVDVLLDKSGDGKAEDRFSKVESFADEVMPSVYDGVGR